MIGLKTNSDEMKAPNKRMHSDKMKLRRFALQLYFAGDAKRYRPKGM